MKRLISIVAFCLLSRSLSAQGVLVTDDALRVHWTKDGAVQRVFVGDESAPLADEGGVYVRDEANPSVWLRVRGDTRQTDSGVVQQCELTDALLRVAVGYELRPGRIHALVSVEDLSGKDRAITVSFRIPLRTSNCIWWQDIRRSAPIERGKEYFVLSSNSLAGARGKLSVYPFSALSKQSHLGLSIGVPADEPRDFVIGLDAEGNFFVEFYLGLTRDAAKFPGRATAEWILYRHDPKWGFRDAARRYYGFYPESFRARSPDGGAWLCGIRPSEIDTPDKMQILGFPPSQLFRYHLLFSGVNADSAQEDNEHGLLSMPFIIALAKLRFPPDAPASRQAPITLLQSVGDKGFAGRLQGFWRGKEAVLSSMLFNAKGLPVLESEEAQRRSLQFPVNPDPDLFAGQPPQADSASQRMFATIERTLVGIPELDGYYFDFVASLNRHINYRREHFAWADFPATFAHEGRAVVLHNRFAIHEFLRELRSRFDDPNSPLHGKLLWANGMKYFCGGAAFEAFLVDIVGFEWPFRPNPGDMSSFDFARTIAYRKPAIHTCNDPPASLGKRIRPEQIPMWYRRMTFLGIPPILRAVFVTDELLRKHAAWVRAYVPLANRLQSAGWRPVPFARTNKREVWIERFGEFGDDSLHLSVYNSSDAAARCVVECEADQLGVARKTMLKVIDLCAERPVSVRWDEGGERFKIPLSLEPYGLAVLRLRPATASTRLGKPGD